jgi:tRNA threonylcarbamoyladenosine biosynthesis protein TsaB
MVSSALEMAGVTMDEIDCVAVDVGPGLFTGIRVGLSAAKGFGLGLGVGLVGLTSLEILAEAASPGRDEAVALVDLRRGEIAWRLPPTGADGLAVVGHGTPGTLTGILRERFGRGGVVVAGDGALRYAEAIAAGVPGVILASPALASPPVASLAVRAVNEYSAGRAKSPVEVSPLYLREADVRIGWTTRHDSPRHSGAAGDGDVN